MAKVTVEMMFPSDLKNEPIIYYMGKNFRVIPLIIEASFSTEMGWAILTLEGDRDEINRLFEYLKTQNITIKHR